MVGTNADVSQRSRRRPDCRSADKRMRKLPEKIWLRANSESTTSREGSICIGSWELKLNSRSATEIMESIGQLDMTDQSPMWAQPSLFAVFPALFIRVTWRPLRTLACCSSRLEIKSFFFALRDFTLLAYFSPQPKCGVLVFDQHPSSPPPPPPPPPLPHLPLT